MLNTNALFLLINSPFFDVFTKNKPVDPELGLAA
jgi:hypothetical protein